MYPTSRARCDQSPERLWAVVSDVTRWPDWVPTFDAVDEIEPRATERVGRRFAVRQPGLPPAQYEVTEWIEGSAFTWIARHPGVRTTATHTVTAQESGSELTLTVDWSGPIAPLVRLVVARKTQRLIDREAATLAAVADARE